MTVVEDLARTKTGMEGIQTNEAPGGEEGLKALGEAESLQEKEEQARLWAQPMPETASALPGSRAKLAVKAKAPWWMLLWKA